MRLIDNKKYLDDLLYYSKFNLNWEKLQDKTILISGSTGLIGRYFIDLLMFKNINNDLRCKIVALGRNHIKAETLFSEYLETDYFEFLEADVNESINYSGEIDYVIHAASNTHPLQYSTDPIGTIKTNVFGTYNLLNLSKKKNVEKFILISSFEVYGSVSDMKKISENDFGIVDCTILRSCYPESKRLSESLCIAFSEQEKINVNIVRLSRVFGPTMDFNSSLATAQFIKNGINFEDIVLKSDGTQLYSYNYVGDAVSSILLVMINGYNKEAYNVSDEKFDCSLREFANIVAEYNNRNVIFDLPEEAEKKGFSNSLMTILDSSKIKKIGYVVNKDLRCRIFDTIEILKNTNKQK